MLRTLLNFFDYYHADQITSLVTAHHIETVVELQKSTQYINSVKPFVEQQIRLAGDPETIDREIDNGKVVVHPCAYRNGV